MGQFLDSVILETCSVTGAAYRGAIRRSHKRLCGPAPKPRHKWKRDKDSADSTKTVKEYLAEFGIAMEDGNPFLDNTMDFWRRIGIITGHIQEPEAAGSASKN